MEFDPITTLLKCDLFVVPVTLSEVSGTVPTMIDRTGIDNHEDWENVLTNTRTKTNPYYSTYAKAGTYYGWSMPLPIDTEYARRKEETRPRYRTQHYQGHQICLANEGESGRELGIEKERGWFGGDDRPGVEGFRWWTDDGYPLVRTLAQGGGTDV